MAFRRGEVEVSDGRAQCWSMNKESDVEGSPQLGDGNDFCSMLIGPRLLVPAAKPRGNDIEYFSS